MPAKKDWLKNKILTMEENTFDKDLSNWLWRADKCDIDKDVKVNGRTKKLGTIASLNFDTDPKSISIKLGKTADDLGYDLKDYTKITVSKTQKGSYCFVVYTE